MNCGPFDLFINKSQPLVFEAPRATYTPFHQAEGITVHSVIS